MSYKREFQTALGMLISGESVDDITVYLMVHTATGTIARPCNQINAALDEQNYDNIKHELLNHIEAEKESENV